MSRLPIANPLLDVDGTFDPVNLVNPYAFAAAGGPSPVGWWKLNDGSGTTATDSSGNGLSGTLINSPSWGTGPNSNGCIDLVRASDQYIDLGNPAALQITGSFSMVAWIKITDTSINQVVLGKDADSGGRAYVIDTSSTFFRAYINGGTGVQGTTNLANNTWYHVGMTYDPAASGGTVKLYVNASVESTETSAGGSIPNATANMMIGRRQYSGFTQPLGGSIDDVRIFNVTLSGAEVTAIYNEDAQ